MSEEARAFYGDYFTRYSQYFSSVSQGTNVEKLQDSGIYEVFEGALLDKYPSAIYKYVSAAADPAERSSMTVHLARPTDPCFARSTCSTSSTITGPRSTLVHTVHTNRPAELRPD